MRTPASTSRRVCARPGRTRCWTGRRGHGWRRIGEDRDGAGRSRTTRGEASRPRQRADEPDRPAARSKGWSRWKAPTRQGMNRPVVWDMRHQLRPLRTAAGPLVGMPGTYIARLGAGVLRPDPESSQDVLRCETTPASTFRRVCARPETNTLLRTGNGAEVTGGGRISVSHSGLLTLLSLEPDVGPRVRPDRPRAARASSRAAILGSAIDRMSDNGPRGRHRAPGCEASRPRPRIRRADEPDRPTQRRDRRGGRAADHDHRSGSCRSLAGTLHWR